MLTLSTENTGLHAVGVKQTTNQCHTDLTPMRRTSAALVANWWLWGLCLTCIFHYETWTSLKAAFTHFSFYGNWHIQNCNSCFLKVLYRGIFIFVMFNFFHQRSPTIASLWPGSELLSNEPKSIFNFLPLLFNMFVLGVSPLWCQKGHGPLTGTFRGYYLPPNTLWEANRCIGF